MSTRSCQIALALRPRESPSSISSRWGSQALAEELRPGCGCGAFIGSDSELESVITFLAGFAGGRHPQPPGGRTGMPAVRKYPPIVSRRMCTAASIRRSDHPRRPKAMTCCLLSSLKTLLTLTQAMPDVWINVLNQSLLWPLFSRLSLAGFG